MLIAAGVRIAGYGIQGLAVSNPLFCVLFYVVPILGAGIGFAELMGVNPINWLRKPAFVEAQA